MIKPLSHGCDASFHGFLTSASLNQEEQEEKLEKEGGDGVAGLRKKGEGKISETWW